MNTAHDELHDRLARLADRAGPEPGPTGADLWERGTRYRRRLRAGTAAIAATTVLSLSALVVAHVQQAGPQPTPAPADAQPGLPSRVHVPSPWLPGTDEVGPPGAVVGVTTTDRGSWTGTEPGVLAISAATGDYRFVDLPGLAAPYDVELSPDGRRLAYWATGPVTGTPNTSDNGGAPIASLAVHDLVDGTVERHDFEPEHGLSPHSMGWTDATGLVVTHLQYVAGDDGSDMDQGYASDASTWVWRVGGEPQAWDAADGLDDWGVPVPGHVAVRTGNGRLADLDPETLELRQLPRGLPLRYATGNAISPDATRIAGVWRTRNGRTPNDVAVAPLDDPSSAVRLRDADQTFRVDGWVDDDHVAVTRRAEPLRDGLAMGVFSVDVETGEPELLVELPEGDFGGLQWASDLLGSPVVDRPAPPTPFDPRRVAGGLVLIAVLGLYALWRWRRGVRP